MGQFELEASAGLSTASRAYVTAPAPVCIFRANITGPLRRFPACRYPGPLGAFLVGRRVSVVVTGEREAAPTSPPKAGLFR